MCSAGNQSSNDGGNNRSWLGSNARNVLSTGVFATGGGPLRDRRRRVTSNRPSPSPSTGTPDSLPEPPTTRGPELACYRPTLLARSVDDDEGPAKVSGPPSQVV